MAKDRPVEIGTTELRLKLADVLNAAVYGEITFVTSRGRRIAAVVPALDGERLQREREAAVSDTPRIPLPKKRAHDAPNSSE
jgi:prevent-host-death family protein